MRELPKLTRQDIALAQKAIEGPNGDELIEKHELQQKIGAAFIKGLQNKDDAPKIKVEKSLTEKEVAETNRLQANKAGAMKDIATELADKNGTGNKRRGGFYKNIGGIFRKINK